MNIPITISQNSHEDELSSIISSATNNNTVLIDKISDISFGLLQAKDKISITENVGWYKTAYTLFQSNCIPSEFVGGV
jgi:hypothetical protein